MNRLRIENSMICGIMVDRRKLVAYSL